MKIDTLVTYVCVKTYLHGTIFDHAARYSCHTSVRNLDIYYNVYKENFQRTIL